MDSFNWIKPEKSVSLDWTGMKSRKLFSLLKRGDCPWDVLAETRLCCNQEVNKWEVLGPRYHLNAFSFKNAYYVMRFRQPSALKRSKTLIVFVKNAYISAQRGNIWNEAPWYECGQRKRNLSKTLTSFSSHGHAQIMAAKRCGREAFDAFSVQKRIIENASHWCGRGLRGSSQGSSQGSSWGSSRESFNFECDGCWISQKIRTW